MNNNKFIECDYCHGQAKLVTGERVYPHRRDLYRKKFYKCVKCDAYVGCHPNSERPLGRVANEELRTAKKSGSCGVRSIMEEREDDAQRGLCVVVGSDGSPIRPMSHRTV